MPDSGGKNFDPGDADQTRFFAMRHGMNMNRTVSTRGFSLLEILTVVALMAIVLGVSIPAISGLNNSGKANQTIAEVAGLLEQARQYAVAQNTYVWVVFNTEVVNGADILHVTVVASRDGTDPQAYGAVPSGAFDLISRVRSFPQVRLTAAGNFTPAQISGLPSTAGAANALGAGAIFNIKIPERATTSAFSQSIRFTPSGEARSASSPTDFIEFGLQPAPTTSTPNTNNIAAIRVNGLTGQPRVYRR